MKPIAIESYTIPDFLICLWIVKFDWGCPLYRKIVVLWIVKIVLWIVKKVSDFEENRKGSQFNGEFKGRPTGSFWEGILNRNKSGMMFDYTTDGTSLFTTYTYNVHTHASIVRASSFIDSYLLCASINSNPFKTCNLYDS